MEQNKKRILIVEDDASLRQALLDKCTREGFAVSEAADGEIGLQKALLEHPDLILLDLLLPKKDGMQFLTELRADEWGKKAKVIILSNVSETQKVADAMAHETFDYLVKSDMDIDKIVETVRTHLGISDREGK